MQESADLIVSARWIIPIEPANAVLEHHAVAIRDGRILSLGDRNEIIRQHPGIHHIALEEHVLIPGLINLHGHSAMSLMRGIADDLPLMRWLEEAIWPNEAKHVSPTFVRDGTLLAAAEMLSGGITTCNDMYFYPDEAAAAFAAAGMRAVIGIAVLEFPTPYASNADEYFSKGLAARDRWLGNRSIGFALAPHAPYTVSDASFRRVVTLAGELNCPIHIHIHETEQEVNESLKQHGARPISRLANLGVLGHNLIGVHAVHLDTSDIELLKTYQCSIAHCPTSNMKLASGVAPTARLLEAGLRVGLGTDGAASNNRLDLFQEMRHAALLAKVSTLDATAVSAHVALRMATLDAASALGIEGKVGSIRPGKLADLCAVSLDALETRPCFDPASHLVYVAGREHVTHVWVGGEPRVENRKLLFKNNIDELKGLSALWQTKLQC